ncbi:MAG: hypothetical protein EOO42_00900 [Flavobacteriales bacterium]|nr:MAG: hypothetical protein EOO42_00900 [Flavobacteriales bacterium]
MRKQPFTNEGFLALQAELYALDNIALGAEASKIANDFNGWMANHFEFADKQVQWLQTLAEQATVFLASQTSIAVGNRLPITLAKLEEGEEEEDKTGKVIKPKANFVATAKGNEAFGVTGNLTIEIFYTG